MLSNGQILKMIDTVGTALQQPMKQQTSDGNLHCPDQSCGLDDGSPAAAGPLITPFENLLTHLSDGCPIIW